MEIVPFRFDHIDNFLSVREFCSPVILIIAEDNEATIQILLKMRSSKLRHIHRTHRVNIDWLYDLFSSTSCRCRLKYVSTKHQLADIHTKAITKADIWTHLTRLSSLHSPAQAPGSKQLAKVCCLRVRCFEATMSTSASALAGAENSDSFVYKCPTCKFVEWNVAKLKIDILSSPPTLCCSKCEPFIGVDIVPRDYHEAVLESRQLVVETMTQNLLSEASPPTLEAAPSVENKKENQADDGMGGTDSPVVDAQTASSQSEELLRGVQQLSIHDAPPRVIGSSIHVEYYSAGWHPGCMFDYDVLEEKEPSQAVPHFAIDVAEAGEDSKFFRSVDPIDEAAEKQSPGKASPPSKPIAGKIAAYLANWTPGSSSQQPRNISIEDASNKVADLTEFLERQMDKPKQFCMRKVAVVPKTEADLHFVSEHTLAQSDERLCPVDAGSGGSPMVQHEQTNIEGDDEEDQRPPDVAMAPDHTDDSIKEEPHRVQSAEDQL